MCAGTQKGQKRASDSLTLSALDHFRPTEAQERLSHLIKAALPVNWALNSHLRGPKVKPYVSSSLAHLQFPIGEKIGCISVYSRVLDQEKKQILAL